MDDDMGVLGSLAPSSGWLLVASRLSQSWLLVTALMLLQVIVLVCVIAIAQRAFL
jgi:hypothetical protein